MPITRRHFLPLAAAAVASLKAGAQQSLPLAGIAYACLRVKQVAVSKAFYQSLGFEELPAAGSAEATVLKVNDHQYLRLYAAVGDELGFMQLGFECANLDAWHEALASSGLKPTETGKTADGNRGFSVDGPAQVRGRSAPVKPQTIEFVDYTASSPLGADFGKHLSADRVGDRLLAVSLPCADPDDARDFYANTLNFKPLPGSPTLLHLPGSSGEYVAIVGGGTLAARAQMVIETSTLGRAERHLHHEHIAFTREATNKDGGLEVFSFLDPDGNALLVQQR